MSGLTLATARGGLGLAGAAALAEAVRQPERSARGLGSPELERLSRPVAGAQRAAAPFPKGLPGVGPGHLGLPPARDPVWKNPVRTRSRSQL